jgi:arginase
MAVIMVPYHIDESRPALDVPAEPEIRVTAELPPGDPWRRMGVLYDRLAGTVESAVQVERATTPVVMSGDCTSSLGTVAGVQRAGIDPVIVWLDAHGDLNTPEGSASGYPGGMPLRLLVGHRPALVADRLGLRAVPEERVVLVGARDLDPPEEAYLAGAGIGRCAVADLDADRIPAGPIYLHVDFDVVDPGDLPGLLYPAPGGPPLAEVAAALRRVMDTGRVAAIGLGCTWHGGRGAADPVRPITTELIRRAL